MNKFVSAFGPRMSTAILVVVGVWVIAMIVGPQLIMVDQSFWHKDRGGDAALISAKIDRLYNDIDMLSYARSDAQARSTSAQRDDEIVDIDTQIIAKRTLIGELEAVESIPEKTYSLLNYMRMGASHVGIFIKTLLAAATVTIIALVVCYPIAYAVAKRSTPTKTVILLLGLVIPYSINELLRVFAWLMILDYNGITNFLITSLGFSPVHFLESGAGVFVAMVYAYILFMVFPIYNTLDTLDDSQLEAANDLGASMWQIHRRIVVPHAKPGIAVGCIMTFMLCAGSYAVPYIMTRGVSEPWFTQLIYNKFFESNDWNSGSAYAFMLLIACIIFVFAMMRLFKIGVKDVAQ